MADFPEIAAYGMACERALARQAKASGWKVPQTSFLQRQICGHAKDLKRLARLSQAGDESGVARKQIRIMRSFSARLCGTLAQLTHHRGSAEPLSPLIWEEFEHLVQTNPLSGHSPDACKVFEINKTNGKNRIITSPWPKTRAAQKSLAEALRARGIASPYDFNCKGKGAKAALLCPSSEHLALMVS